jgi:hypothetical protein
LAANGTAIEGVCVTGEAIRLIVPVVSKPARLNDVSRSGGERVTVASRYGAVFARPNGVSRAGAVVCGCFRRDRGI